MDLNTLYKRIEQGETTAGDAEWLRQYLELLTLKRIRTAHRDEVKPIDTAAAMAAADENERW